MMRVPIFTWMTLVVSFLLVLALPVITAALILLLVDRISGTGFFVASGGGDPVLWQHLFWSLRAPRGLCPHLAGHGHGLRDPARLLPQTPLGYRMVVLAGVFIAVTGFAVWSHHMFAVGLGPIANGYFATATMIVAIPTGREDLQLASHYLGGHISLTTPMLNALAFVGLFTIGAEAASCTPRRLRLAADGHLFHRSPLHYVLFGGAIFGMIGGIYYWYPKITGRLMSEGLGKLQFWVMFIESEPHLLPDAFRGTQRMPRRIYTYSDELGFGWINMLITIGAFIMGFAFMMLAYNIVKSFRNGKEAGKDRGTDTPGVDHGLSAQGQNFDEIPEVRSVRPLWDQKHPEAAGHPPPPPRDTTRRHRHIHLPSPSYWPIVLAFGALSSIFGLLYVNENDRPSSSSASSS